MAEYARLDIPVILPANMKKVEYAEIEDSKIQAVVTLITGVTDGREQYSFVISEGAIPTVDDTALAEGSVALVLANI